MIVEYCTACDKEIYVSYKKDFNYTELADGPFCDRCWFFIKQIQTLEERITMLSTQVSDLQSPTSREYHKKHGLYDASRRR